MGNDSFQCKCSCDKADNQVANLEKKIDNLDDNGNIISNPDKDIDNNNFSDFMKKNSLKKSDKNILSMQNNSNNNNIMYNKEYYSKYVNTNKDLQKVIKIQQFYKTLYLRNLLKKEKSKIEEETDNLVKDLREEYTKLNLKKAESLYAKPFKPTGWKEFFSEDEIKANKKILNFNYGKVYDTKLLRIKKDKKDDNYYAFYCGSVNRDNKRHGFGTTLLEDGSKYEGYWQNGQFTGWGRYIDKEGTIYEGIFTNYKLNGKGLKININGGKYLGDFVDNLKEGNGNEETKEHKYEGQFKNDKKNGSGKLIYKVIKDQYEGEFKDNAITGTGFYTWANKDTYCGTFINGKMHGKGTYSWPDGGQYYGDYVNNIKEGIGKFTWANGKVYEGQFKGGKPDGKGKIKNKDIEIEVEFEDGKMLTDLKEEMKKKKMATDAADAAYLPINEDADNFREEDESAYKERNSDSEQENNSSEND